MLIIKKYYLSFKHLIEQTYVPVKKNQILNYIVKAVNYCLNSSDGGDEGGQNVKVMYSIYFDGYLYGLIKLTFIYQTVSFEIYYFMSIFHFSSRSS